MLRTTQLTTYSVELWLIMILSCIPPLRGLFYSFFGTTARALSSNRSRNQSYGTGLASTRHEIELRSRPNDSGVSNPARPSSRLFKNGGNVAVYGHNESQEEILPGKDEIWITRHTVVEHGTEGARDIEHSADAFDRYPHAR